jgi:non-heme chloroperoxidase
MRLSRLVLPALALAAGTFGHRAARNTAQALQSRPVAYPLEKLRQPPEGERAIITREDGTRLFAISSGNGPTVVLAHGFAISLLEWNIIAEQLVAHGCRVIAFDQRGHGQSTIGRDGIGSQQMAGDYKAVLEHFDVRDAVLVAHSMGGFLAMVFMLTYPEVARDRLKGTVLLSTFAGNVIEGSPQNALQIPLIQSGVMQWVTRSDVYGTLFASTLYGSQPDPSGMKVFLEVFAAQNYGPLLPILRAMAEEDYYRRLGEIQVPCTVICGRLDRTTPPWHSELLAQNIPNATLRWLEGKGHLLNWEAPDAITQAALDLMGQAEKMTS